MIRQVSIFLENKTGRLFEVTKVLADNDINIRALSLADTSDFGILRLIVNEPDKAIGLLKEKKYTVSATQVVAIEIDDKPGGLNGILGIFTDNEINVEYMYAFIEKKSDRAILIFRFDDNTTVVEKLTKKKVNMISEEELLKL